MVEANRILSPEEQVWRKISFRLTQATRDPAMCMRVEIFVRDIVLLAAQDSAGDLTDEQIIEEINQRDSFKNLSSQLDIPDETTLRLVSEARNSLNALKK